MFRFFGFYNNSYEQQEQQYRQQQQQQEQQRILRIQQQLTQIMNQQAQQKILLDQLTTNQQLTQLKEQLSQLQQQISQLEQQNLTQPQLQQLKQLKITQQDLQTNADSINLIKIRQKFLETNIINPDPTETDATASTKKYGITKSNESTTYIPNFDKNKNGVITSQSSQTKNLVDHKTRIAVKPIFPGQDVTPDEESLDPIQIIPFPDDKKITKNVFTINTPFYRSNDIVKEYNFKGDYKITSSSNPNDAYKAFTKDGIWISDNSYKTTQYTSSYYIGSNNNKTTVKQENIVLPGASNNYGSTDIKGEWLQISFPADKPIYLFRYSILVPDPDSNSPVYPGVRDVDEIYTYPKPLPPNKKYTSQFPKSFTVVGSNDDKNWYYIDQHTFVEPPDITYSDNNRASLNNMQGVTINKDKSISFELNSINRYTFYRLIITELFPGINQASIKTWGLYGFVQNVSPNIKTLESFSTQYVTEMSSNFGKGSSSVGVQQLKAPFGDDFSKGIDSKLKRIYIEQLTNLNQARNIPDPLFNLAPYSILENFDSHGFVQYPNGTTNSNAVINTQITPTISIYNDFLSKQTQINNNVYDLSQNIHDFSNNYFNALNAPNDKYDMSGNNFNKPPTQLDGLISDNKEIIMQQNNIFILSTITITTLVLALILVSK